MSAGPILSKCHRMLRVAGWLFFLQLVLGVTGLPRPIKNWFNAEDCRPTEPSRYVVVLGGGGIPSGSSLIRLYYAAEYGRGMTGTTYVVALPAANDPAHSSVGRMRDELVLRGIPGEAIQMETKGRNTREQAVNTAALLGPGALGQPMLVVSSEYHLRRAMAAFQKAGFSHVAALNAAGVDAEADPGMWSALRYGVWGNWLAEVKMLRELVALLGYKLCGWA